jgi:hypothetical protein
MRCLRHPEVETELACGRCETPICPKCLVITDVGARCPACVPKSPSLLEAIGPRYLAQGAAAAVTGGALLGAIWGLILPPGLGGLSFLSLALAFLVGYLVAQAVTWAANRRSGWPLQITAVLGVAVAFLLRNIVAEQALLVSDDVAGYVSAALAALVAFLSLR